MAAQGVCFGVLGRLSVSIDGKPVRLPRSPVLQGLLAALVLARGEPLPAERVATLVWPDRAEGTSRESVQVAVSRLRKWLASLDADGLRVGYTDGYVLDCAPERSDLGRFAILVQQARPVAAPQERYRLLTSAFGEYRGPLLDGLARIDRSDPLVREAINEVRQAGMDLAAAAAATGDPEDAAATVDALTQVMRFDEPLHAALINLLAAADRPAEALRVYGQFSERLSAELGVEPSEEVQLAHLRVLSADRPLDEPGPPAQLPPDVPDFTGRAPEVAQLAGVLVGGIRQSRARTLPVVTVSGMGGLGKSTLAVHVAHKVADAFPAGQLYVDLHGDSASPADPSEVLGMFLRTLGVNGSGVPASVDERAALYRSRLARRRTLIVLDNAATEEQVRPLLPGAPDSAVLITSRNRLVGLSGATLVDLDVLASGQAVDLIAGIIGTDRVAAEPGAAVEIARLCGQVPLALRIASARLLGRRHWTLSYLVDVLAQERGRLDELVAGDLEVRAGFEVSYRQLPARTRRAFRMMGLPEAPDLASWTIAALMDVPVAEARRHLEVLIDSHLVTVARADETGQPRYRLHDLLRLYARELSQREDSEAERTDALNRALGTWLALAGDAAERVPGPCYALKHGPAPRRPLPEGAAELLEDPIRWFDAERVALVAQVGQACDLRLTGFAWDLAASMERYCDVRSVYDDWRHMHERALTLCQETGDRLGEAVMLRGLLEVTTWASPAGDGPAMTQMHRRATRLRELFTELDDPSGVVDALVAMVWGQTAGGDHDEALALASRAVLLAREVDYLGGQARALQAMAVVHGEADPSSARECLEEAIVVAEKLGNRRFIATIVQFLGAARALSGDIDGGRELLDKSIVMARELDDRYLETFSLLYLAKLFAATGDRRARPTIELTISYSEAGNFLHHLADSLGLLGEVHLAEGDSSAAISCLERSVAVWRTRGWIPYLARALRALGDAYAAASDQERARTAWDEARELFANTSDEDGLKSIEQRLG